MSVIGKAVRMIVQLATSPFTSGPATATPKPGSDLRQIFFSQLLGEVRKLLGVYNPRYVGIRDYLLMRQDPVLAFGMGILRAPLINLAWSAESRDPEIKAFIEAVFRPRYRQLAKAGSLAMCFGYQVVEKVWKAQPLTIEISDKTAGSATSKTIPMAWTFDEFKAIDPRTLTLMVENDKYAGVKQTAFAGGGQGELVGPERAAIWSFRRDDVWGDLRGHSLFDQAYEPWYAGAAMEMFANKYYERKASPIPVGRAEPSLMDANGTPIDGFKLMENVILSQMNGGAIVLPSMRDDKGHYRFDLSYLLDDQRGDMYQNRINALDIKKLKAMLISERVGTAGGAGGIGTGEAEVHEDTLAKNLESIQKDWLDEFVNPQVVRDAVVYNFGLDRYERDGGSIKASGLSSSVKTLLKEVLFKLMDAENSQGSGGSVPLHKRMDFPGITKALDLPTVSEDELKELEKQLEEERARMEEMTAPVAAADDESAAGNDPRKRASARLEALGVLRNGEDGHSVEQLGDILTGRMNAELDRRGVFKQEKLESVVAPPTPAELQPITIQVINNPVPQNIEVKTGDTTVQPAQVVINQGAVTLEAKLQLKPGEKKIEITHPDGKKTTGTIAPAEGGK